MPPGGPGVYTPGRKEVEGSTTGSGWAGILYRAWRPDASGAYLYIRSKIFPKNSHYDLDGSS